MSVVKLSGSQPEQMALLAITTLLLVGTGTVSSEYITKAYNTWFDSLMCLPGSMVSIQRVYGCYYKSGDHCVLGQYCNMEYTAQSEFFRQTVSKCDGQLTCKSLYSTRNDIPNSDYFYNVYTTHNTIQYQCLPVDRSDQEEYMCKNDEVLNLSSPTGTLLSPNYPDDYPNNWDCTYIIKAPFEHVIELKFVDFSLEDRTDCVYDYLRVYDGDSDQAPVLGTYCGDRLPGPLQSTDNYITLIFHSDWFSKYRGFKIKWMYFPTEDRQQAMAAEDTTSTPALSSKQSTVTVQTVAPSLPGTPTAAPSLPRGSNSTMTGGTPGDSLIDNKLVLYVAVPVAVAVAVALVIVMTVFIVRRRRISRSSSNGQLEVAYVNQEQLRTPAEDQVLPPSDSVLIREGATCSAEMLPPTGQPEGAPDSEYTTLAADHSTEILPNEYAEFSPYEAVKDRVSVGEYIHTCPRVDTTATHQGNILYQNIPNQNTQYQNI